MTLFIRKLSKAISWRIIGFISLTLITFLLTKSWKLSGGVSLLHSLNQIILYYFHEKIWDRVKWGKLGGVAVQMTGLSGAGKTTIAMKLKQMLESKGFEVEIVDGDEYRKNLCSDLGFSKKDRIENIRRLAFVSHKLSGQGKISIIAAINPYEEARSFLKSYSDKHVTAFINAPLQTVIDRDTKGLYKKALKDKDDPEYLPNFTGISDTFEEPTNPDIIINTDKETIDESAKKLEKFILDRIQS